jgi:hypothetical protein
MAARRPAGGTACTLQLDELRLKVPIGRPEEQEHRPLGLAEGDVYIFLQNDLAPGMGRALRERRAGSPGQELTPGRRKSALIVAALKTVSIAWFKRHLVIRSQRSIVGTAILARIEVEPEERSTG